VLSTWLVSLADTKVVRDYLTFIHRGTREAYFAAYEPVVKDLLARSIVVVACVTDAPERILGWMALEEPDVLHYVWVKKTIRQCRLMSEMLREMREQPMVYTHPPVSPRLAEKFPGWEYRPWYRWPDAKGHASDIPPDPDPFPAGHPYRKAPST